MHHCNWFFMSSDTSSTTLDDSALAELDEILLTGSENCDCLLIDEVHGLLTALYVTNQPIDITNVTQLVYPCEGEHQRLSELLALMLEEIRFILANNKRFEPLVIEEEEDGEFFEEVEGWCVGFMVAVTENPGQWEEISKYEQDLLTPIAKLALLRDEQEEELSEDEYASLLELIPGSVSGLYDYFKSNPLSS